MLYAKGEALLEEVEGLVAQLPHIIRKDLREMTILPKGRRLFAGGDEQSGFSQICRNLLDAL
jgi:hypothetical protein